MEYKKAIRIFCVRTALMYESCHDIIIGIKQPDKHVEYFSCQSVAAFTNSIQNSPGLQYFILQSTFMSYVEIMDGRNANNNALRIARVWVHSGVKRFWNIKYEYWKTPVALAGEKYYLTPWSFI
jgi:hypothetical protein